jgi:hypothetical protein
MATGNAITCCLARMERPRLVPLAEHGESLRADLSKLDPDPRPQKRALADAQRMAGLPSRKPTEEDAPPPSTFPMTPAAKVALELSRGERIA